MPQIDRVSRSFKQELMAQPKVTVFIAPDAEDPMFRCNINGVALKFPKGQMIDVPESVALLIRNSTTCAWEKAQAEAKAASMML